MIKFVLGTVVVGALVSSCAFEDEPILSPSTDGCEPDCETAERHLDPTPRLIQQGAELLLLAVTEDDHAVYQDGQSVYASKLKPGAPRQWVADVPESNVAFPLQVGKVVFLWTDPKRQIPGFGVSPLVVWTSHDGPRVVSTSSAVGTVATAASLDSRQLIFTTNVSENGLRGDLVHARTRYAEDQSVLLADIPLNFPSGLCRPLAGFAGTRHRSFPVATYCADDETTATLSIWKGRRRVDLIDGISTPLPFTLEADPKGRNFFVTLEDGSVVVVNGRGQVDSRDQGGTFGGFVNQRRTAVYAAPAPLGGAELRIDRRNSEPEIVGPLTALFSGLYNGGGYFRSRTASPDGNGVLFGASFDPKTGLTDMRLLNVQSGQVTVLEERNATTVGSDIFTSNSQFALFFRIDDVSTGSGALVAGNHSGSRQVSVGNTVFDVQRGRRSNVSYAQNAQFNPDREFLLSRGDIVVADVADSATPPRLVSTQAYLFFQPSGDRRRLVFSSDAEAAGPGLYVAAARP